MSASGWVTSAARRSDLRRSRSREAAMALLDASGIVKTFGKLTALNGADLSIAENEFHGLIGPNGSGKSTLMKCVAGDETPTQGRGQLAGTDITGASLAERARAGMSLKIQITS